MHFSTLLGSNDEAKCEVVSSEDSCMPQPGQKPYYDVECNAAASLFGQSNRATYVFQGQVDIRQKLDIVGADASLNNVGVLRFESPTKIADEGKVHREAEEHNIGGHGMKNEGGLEINARVRTTNFTNVGGKVRLSGKDARVRSTRFEQKGKDAEIAVFDGAIVESVTGSRTDPMWFKGGKVCGDNATYRGALILSSNSTLQPGDPAKEDDYYSDDTDFRSGHAKLTIDGNLDMDDSTTTSVAIDATNDSSDSVEITGSCNLKGNLRVRLLNKRRKEDITITIMRIQGGLRGRFSGCTGCGAEDKVHYSSSHDERRKLQDADEIMLTIKGTGTMAQTGSPTSLPSRAPTKIPTEAPTEAPTKLHSDKATLNPTSKPTILSTSTPTEHPTPADKATLNPTSKPTTPPTTAPTKYPTLADTGSVNEKPQAHNPRSEQDLSSTAQPSFLKKQKRTKGASNTVAIGAGVGGAIIAIIAVATYCMRQSNKPPSPVPTQHIRSLDLEKRLDSAIYKPGNEMKV